MALDLYSDNSSGTTTSPRISFSYDLSQSDTVPVEQLLRSFSSSSVDFNFCVHENFDHHLASMADELFFDGNVTTYYKFIIPNEYRIFQVKFFQTQIKSKTEKHKRVSPPRRPENEKPRSPRIPLPEEEINQQNSKSFWGFKRSSSCGSGYARSLCPITLLSRSHSTGSSTSSKRSSSSKDGLINQKPSRGFQKPSVSQKPPLRKTSYGYGNNTTHRVNQVLNLGFGSFFTSNNKSKNKK